MFREQTERKPRLLMYAREFKFRWLYVKDRVQIQVPRMSHTQPGNPANKSGSTWSWTLCIA